MNFDGFDEIANVTSHKNTGEYQANHNPRGGFAPGNKAASGNPANNHAAQLRRQARAASSPEDVAEVMNHMKTLFLEVNDVTAGKVWLSYVVGLPVQQVKLTSKGNAPIQVDVAAIVGIIQQEEPDQERQFAMARRILALGNQPGEQPTDGPED
jgi:hypothetical protein